MPGFDQGMATSCMQLMDLVLWNRVDNPKPFLAKGVTLPAVVKARGQFAGFENYPHYSGGIASNIQSHSPGPDFTLYKTVGGIDFYYQT
jgi:hypothetical protein